MQSLAKSQSTFLPSEIAGTSIPAREEKFTSLFGPCARLAWPVKTAAVLAHLGHVTERAAKDWLSGKVAPPAEVAVALFAEIIKRFPRQ